jgi:alpha-galactosidase
MDFGLWVEPEMVNPDSDLYRAHSDWVLHFRNRPRSERRHQLVLNMARDDCREHVFGMLDRLLAENNIKFVKWDHNRSYSEPGWPDAPAGRDREIWVRHVRGVYDILQRLRANHPEVEFESCAGGGGRIDLGIMPLIEQFWPSDNTDPYDNLSIFEGFSLAYAPITKMGWVTEPQFLNGPRKISRTYAFHAAMLGSLGMGAELTKWSQEELEEAKHWIQVYKEIRAVVQHGRLYRLNSPRTSPIAAFEYVAADRSEAVLFVFLDVARYGPHIATLQLRGLEEEALYAVEGLSASISGRALMHRGIQVRLNGAFASQLTRLKRVVE